jgi:hypothetical protein
LPIAGFTPTIPDCVAPRWSPGGSPCPDIRDRLWPFLTDRPRRGQDGRARDEILADLLRSNESIMLNLEELRRRADTGL